MKTCQHCGKQYKSRRTKYCSLKCAKRVASFRSTKFWNDNRASLNEKKKEYRQRPEVAEREKEYRKTHNNYYNEKRREWYSRNIEYCAMKNKERYALRKERANDSK